MRLWRWISLVLPASVLVLLVLLALGYNGYYWWTTFLLGEIPLWWRQRIGLLGFILAIYALYRVAAFHPAFRSQYRCWLELTPWTSRHPLPLGPLQLVWQDAVVVGILFLLMATPHREIFYSLVAFAFVYQVLVAFSLWATGLRWQAYAFLFALGVVVRGILSMWVALALLVILYPFTRAALRRCLERFPWQLPAWLPNAELRPQAIQEQRRLNQGGVGWQYDLLRPLEPGPRVRRDDGTAVCLLLGWWFYAMSSNVPPGDRAVFLMPISVMTFIGTLVRLVSYCGSYWWPISLWGRLWTRHWIIPRYDYVFLAPLLALSSYGLGIVLVMVNRLESPVLLGITAAVPLWILLNVGPNLADWKLTGGHRIAVPQAFSDRNLITRL